MRWQIGLCVTAAAAFSAAGIAVWPNARYAAAVFAAQEDPVALSELQLSAPGAPVPVSAQDVTAALSAGDVDLARSLVDLAKDRGIALPAATLAQVEQAEAGVPLRMAGQFAAGFITGDVTDAASLSGTVLGDLFVYGDIRDVVREGRRMLAGETGDPLILGLAGAGLAVTAATYASLGAGAPMRAGLTVLKDARKAGRIGAPLTAWVGRSARNLVDGPALERAVASASLVRPGKSLTAIKAAFRPEKAAGLMRVAKDVGRVRSAAGTRAALDTLKYAETPRDITRAARLAEAKGSQTRAIFKILGRGALALGIGAFNLAMWLAWAALALLGFVTSIKATAERAAVAWLRRRKVRRALHASQSMRVQPMTGNGNAAVVAMAA